jgi:hypothetical protein
MINEQDKQHIEYGWNHNYDLIKDIQQKVINMGNPGLDMETVDDLLTVIRYKDLERSEKLLEECREVIIKREAENLELIVEFIHPLVRCISELVDWIGDETPSGKEEALKLIKKTLTRLNLKTIQPRQILD